MYALYSKFFLRSSYCWIYVLYKCIQKNEKSNSLLVICTFKSSIMHLPKDNVHLLTRQIDAKQERLILEKLRSFDELPNTNSMQWLLQVRCIESLCTEDNLICCLLIYGTIMQFLKFLYWLHYKCTFTNK